MNLDDLIANESVTGEGADVLRAIARSGQSFLVHALPRDAGKTTLVQAILAEAPPDVARHEFFGTPEEVAALSQATTPGYLLVAEIGHRGRPGYLAEEEVPPIFDLVAGGYSLASSLHADSVEEVFEVLTANGVPTAAASTVPYLIKIRMIKNDAGTHVRRVVDEINKISTVDGEPSTTLLYRWDGRSQGTAESWVEAPEHNHHTRQRNTGRERHTAEGWVGYGDFGAVGDGVTDDTRAIAATHAYANKFGLSVRADDRATYYIGGQAHPAVIQTSTSFGSAHFVIDDTKVVDRQAPIFEVRSALSPQSIGGEGAPAKISRLDRGQRTLPVSLSTACLIIATDDHVRHFIRWGANQNDGAAQKDVFQIGPQGDVDPDNPIVWDFDQISTLEALPIDSEVLHLTGGRFTTIANRDESKYTYYDRNIVVRRSNVVVEGLTHEVTGEQDHGAPYGGFLKIAQCANVMIKDCAFTGHRTYSTIGNADVPVSMGSYDISVAEALNVTFVNCVQSNDINDTTYWGLFGSNYCKNIVLDGCTFSRFDAHQGVYNVTIRNSTLGHMGIHAIGEGTIMVDNTRVLGRSFLHLRPDYGSTWHGDVIIRNCSFLPRAGQESKCVLIEGVNLGQHDFGYSCSMPERITIDGLQIDDSYHPADDPGPTLFAAFNPDHIDASYHEPYPYSITDEVILRNVTTTTGRELRRSDNPYLFRNVMISGNMKIHD